MKIELTAYDMGPRWTQTPFVNRIEPVANRISEARQRARLAAQAGEPGIRALARMWGITPHAVRVLSQ